MKLSAKYAHVLFSGTLSAIMVTVVSGTVVLVNQGLTPDFVQHWLKAFATAWPVAFLTALAVAPVVRRVVAKLTVPSE